MRDKEYGAFANWNWVIISIIIFTICMLLILYMPGVRDFDWIVLKSVRSFLAPYPSYIPLFFSEFGLDYNLLWPQITVCCSLLTAQKYLKAFFFVFYTQATILTVDFVKHFVCRERPCGDAYPGFSFPSGHAAKYTCVLGIVIYLIMHYVRNRFWRYFLSVFFGVYIFMVCISRMWLSHHFPIDVFAGFFVGILYINLFIITCKFFEKS